MQQSSRYQRRQLTLLNKTISYQYNNMYNFCPCIMRKKQSILPCLLLILSTILPAVLAHGTHEGQQVDSSSSNQPQDDSSDFTIVKYEWWKKLLFISVCTAQVLTILCCAIFLTSILSRLALRSVSYNVYLVMLVIPEIIINGSYFLIGSHIFFLQDEYEDEGTTAVFVWNYLAQGVTVFYYMSSFWMNFIICFEMYSLVKKSKQREAFSPPSLRKVCIQGICVYSFALLLAIWFALDVPWSPLTTSKTVSGSSLGDTNTRLGSPEGGLFTKTAAISFCLSLVFLPTIYVLYVVFVIWWRQLLPKSGRTRVIFLYFLRIILAFFAFYYPSILIGFVKTQETENSPGTDVPFILWNLRRFLEITQALFTLYLSNKKTDIRAAIQETVTNICSGTQTMSDFCCFLCCTESHHQQRQQRQQRHDNGLEAGSSEINAENPIRRQNDKSNTNFSVLSWFVIGACGSSNSSLTNDTDNPERNQIVVNQWEEDDVYDEYIRHVELFHEESKPNERNDEDTGLDPVESSDLERFVIGECDSSNSSLTNDTDNPERKRNQIVVNQLEEDDVYDEYIRHVELFHEESKPNERNDEDTGLEPVESSDLELHLYAKNHLLYNEDEEEGTQRQQKQRRHSPYPNVVADDLPENEKASCCTNSACDDAKLRLSSVFQEELNSSEWERYGVDRISDGGYIVDSSNIDGELSSYNDKDAINLDREVDDVISNY